jgi:TRAP-type C4-dicarboxylate transport system permease large subunit
MAMIVLTVPIFFPVITALGFHPIWFGIIIVKIVEIGQITPPVGINVFVIKGVAKDVPMYTIFRGIVPFLIASAVEVVLLCLFPQIATFLPDLMKV